MYRKTRIMQKSLVRHMMALGVVVFMAFSVKTDASASRMEELSTVEETEEVSNLSVGMIAYGIGTGYTWQIDAMGKLTVRDDETDVCDLDNSDWIEYKNQITEADIECRASSHCAGMFENFVNLNKAIVRIDSMEGSFASMFSGCKNLTLAYVLGDVTNVTDMSFMFYDCEKLESMYILGGDEINKLKNMRAMFYGCRSLKESSVTNLNTENVEDMGYMFYNCSGIEHFFLNGWKTDSVTDMEGMFGNCSAATYIYLSYWNTEKVTNMKNMFSGCSNVEEFSFYEWNPKNVVDMDGMFRGCSKVKLLNLRDVNMDSVMKTQEMFLNCESLEKVIFPRSLHRIGKSAFLNCGELKKISLPEGIESIEKEAFGYCSSGKMEGCIIEGYEGTTAEQYAKENGMEFIPLDEDGIPVPKQDITPISAKNKIGNLTNYEITLSTELDTEYIAKNKYAAEVPKIVAFWDKKNRYQVAYPDGDKVIVQRYNDKLTYLDSISLTMSLPKFGNVAFDDKGFYYLVTAQDDENSENISVISVAKYDEQGNLLKDYQQKSGLGDFDTKYPFSAANCSIAINGDVLGVYYGRQMFNGHQSDTCFFLDCNQMIGIEKGSPYTSHSFDQRIIPLSNGGFLLANQGDAYGRGFGLSYYSDKEAFYPDQRVIFHFREGTLRAYGYNLTFAQLGGIVENDNSYAFVGSSERTLTLKCSESKEFWGHNEPRDLFIQVFDKNYEEILTSAEYEKHEAFLSKAHLRKAVGEHDEGLSSDIKIFLNGDEKDYGIVWLTRYEGDDYVANPKVVKADNGQLVVLWEKRNYSDSDAVNTYYMILNENGTPVTEPIRILDCLMTGNTDPYYRDGKVYWTTCDRYGSAIHVLDLSNPKPYVFAKSVEILNTEHVLNHGETLQLVARVLPENADNKELIFKSDGQGVSIDENGLLTVTSTPYTATITVYSKENREVRATYEVTTQTISNDLIIYLDYNALSWLGSESYKLDLNQSTTITAKAYYVVESFAAIPDNRDISVKVENEDIVEVNVMNPEDYYSESTITILAKKIGKTNLVIEAADGGASKSIEINVAGPNRSIRYHVDTDYFYESEYTEGTSEIELINPEKEGYIFEGWYLEEDYQHKITKIEPGMTGDIDLYAKWREDRNVFSDVDSLSWKYTFAKYAYDKGMMTGKATNEDGTVKFAPDDKLTRAELVQILYSLEGKPDVEFTQTFTDVTEGDWFRKAVLWANANGIANGVSDGVFNPLGKITREQVATMLKKYAQYKGYDVTASTDLNEFPDASEVSSWATGNISWAVAKGVISGKAQADGTKKLDPKGDATRAECAAMLKSFCEKVAEN